MLAKKKGWKSCPQCGLVQERTYGCFHMTCSNPQCRTDYCDECGDKLDKQNWQQHFNIGKCQLWRDPDKDLINGDTTKNLINGDAVDVFEQFF